MTSSTPENVTRQRVHFPSNFIANLQQNVNFASLTLSGLLILRPDVEVTRRYTIKTFVDPNSVFPSYQGDSTIFHKENFLKLEGVVFPHPPLS